MSYEELKGDSLVEFGYNRYPVNPKICATCKYSNTNLTSGACNYIGITGHMKPTHDCSNSHCSSYEADPAKKRHSTLLKKISPKSSEVLCAV